MPTPDRPSTFASPLPVDLGSLLNGVAGQRCGSGQRCVSADLDSTPGDPGSGTRGTLNDEARRSKRADRQPS